MGATCTKRQPFSSAGPPRTRALAVAAAAALACAAPSATAWATTPTAPTKPAAPKPPTVHTGYASPLSPTSALVRAKVGPRGSATEYHFEYGTTTAYGAQTPATSAGSGSQEAAVAQTIGGLAAYTTYHYRVIATSAAGTAVGGDAVFTTRKMPLSLSLASEPNPVIFGSPLTVSGVLSGTGDAGVAVVLQGNPFPYTHGFHNLTAPQPAGATGAFTFPLADVLASTQLRVSTVAKPVIHSPVVTVIVTVHVTLHVRHARRRGFVRLYGTVTPAAPGAAVAFELMNRQGRYVPVSGTRVGRRGLTTSRFARTVRLRQRGLYRAFVQVPGGAQVSGYSRTIKIR
jgi:hypothetical protein